MPKIACAMAARRAADGTIGHLRERDFNTVVKDVLSVELSASVIECVVTVPGWPSLGRSTTDTIVETRRGSRLPRLAGELKWVLADGPNKIYEAMWDLFKMALETRIPTVQAAYLITGAPPVAWERDPCADLLGDGVHDVPELCMRRSNTPKQWLIWDWLLEGGHDRAPDLVPSPLRTIAMPRVSLTVARQSWELRAVRVDVPSAAVDVPFIGGWPHERRPADAKRPAN